MKRITTTISKRTKKKRILRRDWKQAFQAAGSSKQDQLLLEKLKPNRFDRKEWNW